MDGTQRHAPQIGEVTPACLMRRTRKGRCRVHLHGPSALTHRGVSGPGQAKARPQSGERPGRDGGQGEPAPEQRLPGVVPPGLRDGEPHRHGRGCGRQHIEHMVRSRRAGAEQHSLSLAYRGRLQLFAQCNHMCQNCSVKQFDGNPGLGDVRG